MDFFEVVARRRSIREFQPREIDPKVLERLLEAVRLAPSAGDLQAYRVYVVREAGRRQALARAAAEQDFIAQASVALVFCALPRVSGRGYRRRGEELYCLQDATIAATFALLAATALGLGSCWVGAFDEGGVRRIVGAPGEERPVAILALGYPAEAPEATPRIPMNELVRYR